VFIIRKNAMRITSDYWQTMVRSNDFYHREFKKERLEAGNAHAVAVKKDQRIPKTGYYFVFDLP